MEHPYCDLNVKISYELSQNSDLNNSMKQEHKTNDRENQKDDLPEEYQSKQNIKKIEETSKTSSQHSDFENIIDKLSLDSDLIGCEERYTFLSDTLIRFPSGSDNIDHDPTHSENSKDFPSNQIKISSVPKTYNKFQDVVDTSLEVSMSPSKFSEEYESDLYLEELTPSLSQSDDKQCESNCRFRCNRSLKSSSTPKDFDSDDISITEYLRESGIFVSSDPVRWSYIPIDRRSQYNQDSCDTTTLAVDPNKFFYAETIKDLSEDINSLKDQNCSPKSNLTVSPSPDNSSVYEEKEINNIVASLTNIISKSFLSTSIYDENYMPKEMSWNKKDAADIVQNKEITSSASVLSPMICQQSLGMSCTPNCDLCLCSNSNLFGSGVLSMHPCRCKENSEQASTASTSKEDDGRFPFVPNVYQTYWAIPTYDLEKSKRCPSPPADVKLNRPSRAERNVSSETLHEREMFCHNLCELNNVDPCSTKEDDEVPVYHNIVFQKQSADSKIFFQMLYREKDNDYSIIYKPILDGSESLKIAEEENKECVPSDKKAIKTSKKSMFLLKYTDLLKEEIDTQDQQDLSDTFESLFDEDNETLSYYSVPSNSPSIEDTTSVKSMRIYLKNELQKLNKATQAKEFLKNINIEEEFDDTLVLLQMAKYKLIEISENNSLNDVKLSTENKTTVQKNDACTSAVAINVLPVIEGKKKLSPKKLTKRRKKSLLQNILSPIQPLNSATKLKLSTLTKEKSSILNFAHSLTYKVPPNSKEGKIKSKSEENQNPLKDFSSDEIKDLPVDLSDKTKNIEEVQMFVDLENEIKIMISDLMEEVEELKIMCLNACNVPKNTFDENESSETIVKGLLDDILADVFKKIEENTAQQKKKKKQLEELNKKKNKEKHSSIVSSIIEKLLDRIFDQIDPPKNMGDHEEANSISKGILDDILEKVFEKAETKKKEYYFGEQTLQYIAKNKYGDTEEIKELESILEKIEENQTTNKENINKSFSEETIIGRSRTPFKMYNGHEEIGRSLVDEILNKVFITVDMKNRVKEMKRIKECEDIMLCHPIVDKLSKSESSVTEIVRGPSITISTYCSKCFNKKKYGKKETPLCTYLKNSIGFIQNINSEMCEYDYVSCLEENEPNEVHEIIHEPPRQQETTNETKIPHVQEKNKTVQIEVPQKVSRNSGNENKSSKGSNNSSRRTRNSTPSSSRGVQKFPNERPIVSPVSALFDYKILQEDIEKMRKKFSASKLFCAHLSKKESKEILTNVLKSSIREDKEKKIIDKFEELKNYIVKQVEEVIEKKKDNFAENRLRRIYEIKEENEVLKLEKEEIRNMFTKKHKTAPILTDQNVDKTGVFYEDKRESGSQERAVKSSGNEKEIVDIYKNIQAKETDTADSGGISPQNDTKKNKEMNEATDANKEIDELLVEKKILELLKKKNKETKRTDPSKYKISLQTIQESQTASKVTHQKPKTESSQKSSTAPIPKVSQKINSKVDKPQCDDEKFEEIERMKELINCIVFGTDPNQIKEMEKEEGFYQFIEQDQKYVIKKETQSGNEIKVDNLEKTKFASEIDEMKKLKNRQLQTKEEDTKRKKAFVEQQIRLKKVIDYLLTQIEQEIDKNIHKPRGIELIEENFLESIKENEEETTEEESIKLSPGTEDSGEGITRSKEIKRDLKNDSPKGDEDVLLHKSIGKYCFGRDSSHMIQKKHDQKITFSFGTSNLSENNK